jgi:predicted membrane chloride channel (bestrophin family)
MLIFRKGTPWYLIWRTAGSAILPSMPAGLVSAIVTLLIEILVPRDYMDRLLQHPYPFQPFAYAAAFALVFRTNVAYNRYWECTTSVTLMMSKWGDALVEALTFDELINTNKRLDGEEGERWLEQRRRFQALMIRRYSLMNALALQYMRRDDSIGNLVRSSGRNSKVPLALGAFGGMQQPTSRSSPEWQQLEVLGGLVPTELDQLESSADRVGYVYTTILHLSNQRRADGGLGADAPVLSRYYQLLSDGMLGFRQARKIEDIPFPWPYTQAVSSFLTVFVMLFPLVLSHFANCGADRTCDNPTWWIGPFIAFITSTSYVTLQQVLRAPHAPHAPAQLSPWSPRPPRRARSEGRRHQSSNYLVDSKDEKTPAPDF